MKTACRCMSRPSQINLGAAELWCEAHNAPIAHDDVCVVVRLEELAVELHELREEFVKFKALFVR